MKSPAPHCITETINGTLVEIYELKDGNWRARYKNQNTGKMVYTSPKPNIDAARKTAQWFLNAFGPRGEKA